MKFRNGYRRAAMSFALAMAVGTVFTLRSFAAPEITKSVVDPVLAQDCTGTLTVKAGQVTINGNAAQTGATVMTGSVIATGSNGKAIVDLGAVGRVELGDNTSATITCAAGSVQITTTCKTEIEVRKGSVNVTSPTAETVSAGQKRTYSGGMSANGSGGIDVKVECEGGRRAGAGPFVGAGLIGLLALLGVGAAVAIGVAVGGNDESTANSPTR